MSNSKWLILHQLVKNADFPLVDIWGQSGVAALKWVQDNVANFGGDPSRVMIYGQSGGGSKVTTLLSMPSAEGLIHRASIQSGGGGNPPSADASREFARQVMKELSLGPTVLLALVAGLASYMPARRAARTDPLTSLRSE